MKILALETSAKSVSCAVVEDGAPLASAYQCTGLTHSRTLLPMVVRWSSPAATVRLLRVLHGRRRRWLRASIKWTISVLSVRMRPLSPTGRAAGAISTPRIRFTKRRQVGQFVGGRAAAAVRPFPVPRRSFRCAGNACGDCVPCRNITARGLRQSRPP